MKLYIDNLTNSLVTSATIATTPAITLFKEDILSVEIQFVASGLVVDIGTPTLRLALGLNGSLIALTETWVKSGTGATTKWTGTLNLNTQQAEIALAGQASITPTLEVEARQGSAISTKAQAVITLKTDLINAIDSQTDIGNISITDSGHTISTTSVHGIANTAALVVTSDSRLSDSRRPLSYPVLSETLFSGVTIEKRVHTRSYNSGDQFWETNIAVTQLPLVLDTYHDPAVIWEDSEDGWSVSQSPSVAFGTSNTSGLIFENEDEGIKIMRLGTIVVPPLPSPAPSNPYTTTATFVESFSAIIWKAGDWYSSAFASKWNNESPSRNIFNSSTSPSNDQSETIRDWQLETHGYNSSYDSFNVAMASTNILLRCSKRYTSWTNGVSPSVEGNGNIIVEIIFYGTPDAHRHGNITNDGKIGTTTNRPLITSTDGSITTGSFGTNANTFCMGNDSRLSDARTPRLTKLTSRENIGSSTFLPITITGITKSGGVGNNVVITTASAHGYAVNDIVYITGLQTATAGTTGLGNLSTLNGNYVVTAVTATTFTYFPNSNTALSTLYGAVPKLVERIITKGVIGDMEVGNDYYTSSDCLFVCMTTFSASVTSGTPLPVGVTYYPTWKKVALVNLR